MSQHGIHGVSGGAVDLSYLTQRAATPATGAAAPGAPTDAHSVAQVIDIPAVVFDVSEQNFQQAAQLSGVVPVIVNLWSSQSPDSSQLNTTLAQLVREFRGQLVLAMVEAEHNMEIVQAFQAQSVPTVVALVGGRPLPLFQGAAPESQIRELFQQLTDLAAQQGMTGRVSAPDLDGEVAQDTAPAEAPVNPAHLPALAALEQADYATAAQEYERVLLKAPADAEARAALAQVQLLLRLQGRTADEIRAAAGANASDIEAQLLVADLDVSGGHLEDAFLRILDLFAVAQEAEVRAHIRNRLLELFDVVGQSDPRVTAARGRLANLLY